MTGHPSVAEPTGGWREPWPRVFELADAISNDRWALVGGLMVQAHAMAAHVKTSRVTLDVDAAVRVEAGVFSYTQAAAALVRLGYAVDRSTQLTYRFVRDADMVDLMVGDHEHPAPYHARRPVMAITGGQQALSRIQLMYFQSGGAKVAVPIPTLHGALVLKAAAYTVDSRDRDRHLLDSVALLACIADTDSVISDLRGSDRKRLVQIIDAFNRYPAITTQAPSDTLRLAQRTADEFRAAFT